MYRDELLDLYKNPRNEGKIEDGVSAESTNPSCGDETEISVKLDDGDVSDVKHQTDGCAICTASISILTDEIKGLSREEVMELDKDWMLEELGVDVSPMRVKCAVLGLKTVQSALEDSH